MINQATGGKGELTQRSA